MDSSLLTWRCAANVNEQKAGGKKRSEKGPQKTFSKGRVFETPSGMKAKIDPVGILNGVEPLIAKPLAIYLRDRSALARLLPGISVGELNYLSIPSIPSRFAEEF